MTGRLLCNFGVLNKLNAPAGVICNLFDKIISVFSFPGTQLCSGNDVVLVGFGEQSFAPFKVKLDSSYLKQHDVEVIR